MPSSFSRRFLCGWRESSRSAASRGGLRVRRSPLVVGVLLVGVLVRVVIMNAVLVESGILIGPGGVHVDAVLVIGVL